MRLKVITFLIIGLLGTNGFATVLTTSTVESEMAASPFLRKKFQVNVAYSTEVLGIRGGVFFRPNWGVTMGVDKAFHTTDIASLLTYRWSAGTKAFETLAVKAGPYYTSQISPGENLSNPFGIMFEMDVTISLSPKDGFLLFGYSTKSYNDDDSENIIDDRAAGLFRVGLGNVF